MKLQSLYLRQKSLANLIQRIDIHILAAIKEVTQVNDRVYVVFPNIGKELILKEVQKMIKKQFVIVSAAKSASHK